MGANKLKGIVERVFQEREDQMQRRKKAWYLRGQHGLLSMKGLRDAKGRKLLAWTLIGKLVKH